MELKGNNSAAEIVGGRKIQPFLSFYHFLLAGLAQPQFPSSLPALSDVHPECQHRKDPHHLNAAISPLAHEITGNHTKEGRGYNTISILTFTAAHARNLHTIHEV